MTAAKNFVRTSLAALYIGAQPAIAAQWSVAVVDKTGQPIADAVVELSATDGSRPPARTPGVATLDQIDKQFVPHVLAIRTGTAVAFPNSDNIRHHVYSFSDAKRFELKLYAGTAHSPVVFDRAGTVVLGCNIHDRMKAYVYVFDTPWFAVTDARGRASIGEVPIGRYRLDVWHPRHAHGRTAVHFDISIDKETDGLVETLDVSPDESGEAADGIAAAAPGNSSAP